MISIKSDVFRLCEKDGVTFLKFRCLDSFNYINHTVSTRLGGVSSQKELSSMNLGTYTDDDFDNVKENYRIFCEATGYDKDSIVLANQTHETNIYHADYTDRGKGVFKERDYERIDALITDKKHLPLVIHTADCVPVSFIDKKARAIAIAHCGWRGTFNKLCQKVVCELDECFGIKSEDLFCTVGPAICHSCYEVSGDLYFQFASVFGSTQCLVRKDEKFFVDLMGLNRQMLIDMGVLPGSVVVSDICTKENTDLLFSHRGQGPKRGIFATFVELC